MTLADLRRLSIKKQWKVRFRLQNGMDCVVTEHGIAQIPELKGAPDFNLEQELASAGEFVLEPVVRTDRKNASKPTTIGRAEMESMTAAGQALSAAAEHDE
jgi:hypothetical protein